LAASIRSRFGIEVKITPGQIGQFDVVVDGTPIFSKHQVGRFPNEGEVERQLGTISGKGAPASRPRS
jgi:predicted Rdx family selenoprotein